MSDRPILFSGSMTLALLAGRKSQTRRTLKPQPCTENLFQTAAGEWRERLGVHGATSRMLPLRFAVGDRLWVRETWAPLSALRHSDPGTTALSHGAFFRADDSVVDGEIDRWRPSIFMPRRASRMTLVVTDVRVQQLQSITEADAIDEGALSVHLPAQGPATERGRPPLGASPRRRFQHLWETINGPDAWGENPWVAAIVFEVHRCNIDQLAPGTAEMMRQAEAAGQRVRG